MLAVGVDACLHLGREFARRHQDQRTHRRAAVCATRLFGELLQNGQGEACGLAGAGLGAAHEVTAGKHGGNRLCLDRGRFGIALLADGKQ